jgi:hypothetical protein
MEPVLCPLCTRTDLERLPESGTIVAKIDHENMAHGVMAYCCTEYDHIFFLRRADVNSSFETPASNANRAKVRQVAHVSTVPCPACWSTGFDSKHDFCNVCEGTGELHMPLQVSACSVCTLSILEQLLQQVTISAKLDGDSEDREFCHIAVPKTATSSLCAQLMYSTAWI